MSLSIIILAVIIIIDLIVVAAVLNWGAKHDSHTDIRSSEASKAVQQLQTQAKVAEEKQRTREAAALAAQQLAQADTQGALEAPSSAGAAEKEAAAQSAAAAEADVKAALGDEEAKRKRREAALARKAARATSRQTESEG